MCRVHAAQHAAKLQPKHKYQLTKLFVPDMYAICCSCCSKLNAQHLICCNVQLP